MKLRIGDSDEALEAAIRSLDAISVSTRDLYVTKLRALSAAVTQATGSQTTVLRAVSRPIQSYAALTSYRIRRGTALVPLKPHTVHVTVSVAIALFKHFPELTRSMPKDTRLMWQNIAEQTRDEAVGKYEDLTPTAEQRASYVPFHRIISKRDELLKMPDPTAHQRVAALVLSLYSMFPPRRSQDWAVMSVFDARKRSDSLLLGRSDVDSVYPNRMIVSRNGRDMRVVFTSYKTSRKYGRQEFAVPAPLFKVVMKSLEHRPRRYLFERSADPNAPLNSKRFSELVANVLRSQFSDVTGLPNIAMLRHSYIVAADVGHLTPRVAQALANQMGHSRLQQLSYAYNIEEGEGGGPSPPPGVCRLTCA